jgi:hypothetical protein
MNNEQWVIMAMKSILKFITFERWKVMMSLTLFIVHCSLFISPADAQTFTQRIQKSAQGQGTITIHQDKAIDNLVNGTTVTPTATQAKPATSTSQAEKKQTTPHKDNNRETIPTVPVATPSVSSSSSSETTVPAIDTVDVAKVRTYKVMGYRVQAFAGGNSRKDRQKAEQTGNQLRALFPNEQVYTHFYSPRWICRIGNYRTYEEAHQMLQEVKNLGYTSATIVKGKISVPY